MLSSGELDRVVDASAVAAARFGDAVVEATTAVLVEPAAFDDTAESLALVHRPTVPSMLDATPVYCVCAPTKLWQLLMRLSSGDGTQLA